MIRPLPRGLGPARAFAFLSDRPHLAFLDSGVPGPLARRSYLASDPFLVASTRGRDAVLEWPRSERREEWAGNPFDLLRRLLREHRAEPGPFPLAPGGAIGYLAYDLYPQVEALARSARDDLGLPDLFLAFYDAVGVFDLVTGEAALALSDWGEPGRAELEERWAALRPGPEPPPPPPPRLGGPRFEADLTREAYRASVLAAKAYIAAGDVYQVNLSQRFVAPCPEAPHHFYRRLRSVSPAPFGGFLSCGDFAVLSNSPERYLAIRGDAIETRPIKGTRPRGRTPEEDRRLAEELRRSVKDRAEHVMIVDLERNDLGRVCEYASVHVPAFEVVESYANVHHLVSTVAGRVHPDRDAVACIRNSFPGGSITGAPKVRALEIIDELEPTARGVYCGSVGYVDFAGEVDLNIAIRTATHRGERLYFQVGGGIVADSDPEEEYEETLTKAQAFLAAITGEGRVWTGSACA